ncbi:MAG: glycosylase [Bacteroidales bacterium]|nr:glycosylase [Candidatus Colimorpha onthohippi]
MKFSLSFFLLLLTLFVELRVVASNPITQKEMENIYNIVKTPVKYGLVVAPADSAHMTDSPTVFRFNNRWYMTYLIFDEKGYQTAIAESDDLLHWKSSSLILSRSQQGWDKAQRGGYAALVDSKWGGSYELERFQGRYWMSYLGGALEGYETRPLHIGMAYSDNPVVPHEWEVYPTHVLSPLDSASQWFEKVTQYKSAVFRDKERHFGYDFVMFYNAYGVNEKNGLGAERIGIACSNDMIHWDRYAGNPVVSHEDDNTISGDAHIQQIGNLYVMFYFRAFDPHKPYKAYNTFACSRDLVHWYDWQGEDLIYPSESYDERYAHKSYLVNWNGVTYHFYCAVNNRGQRGIALATSVPMGKSEISFCR